MPTCRTANKRCRPTWYSPCEHRHAGGGVPHACTRGTAAAHGRARALPARRARTRRLGRLACRDLCDLRSVEGWRRLNACAPCSLRRRRKTASRPPSSCYAPSGYLATALLNCAACAAVHAAARVHNQLMLRALGAKTPATALLSWRRVPPCMCRACAFAVGAVGARASDAFLAAAMNTLAPPRSLRSTSSYHRPVQSEP